MVDGFCLYVVDDTFRRSFVGVYTNRVVGHERLAQLFGGESGTSDHKATQNGETVLAPDPNVRYR